MENNYSVYQHVTPDNMHYYGQTNNIKRRWSNNGARYKKTSLQPYIEKYGWDNIQHIVLFENQSKEDALWIEDFLITTARQDGVCINKHRSGLVSKEEGYKQEYREQNKDKIKQYYEENKDKFKEYYEKNKDKKLEYQQQYYEQNKDKKQQYYEKNKDKILEQQKQYREQNKDRIQEYNRQYYQRKKEENQLKELGCIPLF